MIYAERFQMIFNEERNMRKYIPTSVLSMIFVLLAINIACALDTDLSYTITNNANKQINVKLKSYNGNTRVNADVAANSQKSGSWKYDVNSSVHQVVLKVSYSGSNNDIGCTVYPGSSYAGWDRTLTVTYDDDKVLRVTQCDGPNGCYNKTCNAVLLNP